MQNENGNKRATYKRFDDTHLRDYFQVIFVRKWLILLISLLFVGASILYVRRLPPVYRSQALMMREDTSETLPEGVFGSYSYYSEKWDVGQELLLKSTPLLAQMKQRLLEEYRIDLELEQIGESISLSPYKESSTTIQLTAVANTPEQAQALANTAADTYIGKTAEMKRTELNQGLAFLKKQMDALELKIQEAEQALSDFREREGLISTTTEIASSGLIEKLGNMHTELTQTESEIDLVKSQLQSVEELISEKRKLARASAATELSSQIDQLQERLITLELDLNTMLETRTRKDPEVIALQTKIDVVRRQLNTEFAKVLESPGSSLDPIAELQSLTQQSITLNVQLKGLERKSELVTARINSFREEHPELVSKELEFTRLERRARVYEQTYTTLMGKYEDMRLREQMITSGWRVTDRAPLPESPISPNKKRDMGFGALLGLFLGIGAAFFLEYMDDSIRRPEDVERFLDLPLTGAIPRIEPLHVPEEALNRGEDSSSKGKKRSRKQSAHSRKDWQELLSHSLLYSTDGGWKSPGVESYWNLAANIRFANVDSPLKSLLVTSAMPGEGKTITASNLAIVMAQSGKRTLLIDADLRRPSMHRIFHQDRAPGLTDLLISDNGMSSDSAPGEFIRPTDVENLYLMTSGTHVSNPGALLPSEKMRELVKTLSHGYDLLIFDSPPLGSVADAIALSTEVDGTLMVIYAGETKRKIGFQARESLENVNAEVIGAVLNNVDYSKHYGYPYYTYKYSRYYKYYSDDGGSE